MKWIGSPLVDYQLTLPQTPVVSASLTKQLPLDFTTYHTRLTFPALIGRGVGVSWPPTGAPEGGRIVRAIPAAPPSTTLYLQTITGLATEAQWESFAALTGSAIKPQTDFALFRVWDVGVDRVVLVYWSATASGGQHNLVWRYSDDQGATWSNEATISGYTFYDGYVVTGPPYNEWYSLSQLAPVGGPDGGCGFLYRRGLQKVYEGSEIFEYDEPKFIKYTVAGGWAAASAAAPGPDSGATGQATGVYNPDSDKVVLFRATSTASYGRIIRNEYDPAAGTWSGNVTVKSEANVSGGYGGYGYLWAAESAATLCRGYFWLTYRRYDPDQLKYVYSVLPLDAELRRADAFEFDRVAAATAQPVNLNVYVHWAGDDGQVMILDNLDTVKVSDPISETTGLTVLEYDVDVGRWGQKVVCKVDNRAGLITGPPILGTLKISRGLRLSHGDPGGGATDYLERLPAFYVTKFRFEQGDKAAVFEGIDGLALLSLWTATDSWIWEGVTYREVIESLCALLRLTPTFSGDSWTETVSRFAIHPGTNGLEALQRLMGGLGGVVAISQDDVIKFTELYYDSWDYQLGGCWETSFGQNVRANYAYVVGQGAAESVGDYSLETEGLRLAVYHYNAHVADVAGAEQAAQYILTDEQARGGPSGEIIAPVNYGLQVADLIEFDTGWAATISWEVAAIEERYRRDGDAGRPYRQKVKIYGV